MTSLTELLQQGASNGWFFVPTAIALGALHGLEPGHSKSLMAAFIVAVHGTVKQAILLGLAATFSHTLVVWVVALIGLSLGQGDNATTSEPYFQLASAVLILGIGTWMLLRIRKAQHPGHDHGHHHDHAHDHDHDHSHEHSHDDAHSLAHAQDISERFAGKQVTTLQIILFGLTGGLIPCPAAITVLIVCLQLKQFTLGVVLVLCFSIGLALTLVASGVIASLGLRAAVKRWHWITPLIHKAPYLAGAITLLIGAYIGYDSLVHIYHNSVALKVS